VESCGIHRIIHETYRDHSYFLEKLQLQHSQLFLDSELFNLSPQSDTDFIRIISQVKHQMHLL
jgi:hypothetical protein